MTCILALEYGNLSDTVEVSKRAAGMPKVKLHMKEVQRRLKRWGYYSGSVDGIFGAGTRAAVIAFQKKNGLTADGVVGKATYKALGMTASYNVLAGGGSGGSTYTSSDLYLLAKTIYAEGRGEPYAGQVAIGAVILNRVRSP